MKKSISRLKVLLVEKNVSSNSLVEQLSTISRWCTNKV